MNRKQTILTFLLLTASLYVFSQAQGLYNNGGDIIVTSGVTVYITGNSGDFTNATNSTDGEVDLDGTIKLQGDWVNNAGNNVFVNIDTDGEVEFYGSAAQLIDGSAETYFEKAKINNSAADVTMDVNATVQATLTLTTNDLILGSNTLTLGKTTADVTISGGSATTYIQADGTGVVKYYHNTGATAYSYPVGCDAKYTPLTFNTATSTLTAGDYTSLNVTDAVHPNKGTQTHYLTRYWTLTNGGITDIDYNISYIYDDTDIEGTETSLLPYKYSSSAWTTGGSVADGTNTLSWSGVNSFSDLTGFADAPLPVELLDFNLICDNGSVSINWTTATETNNDFFTVETRHASSQDEASFLQSDDDWESITTIPGAGNSTTTINYEYIDNNNVETRHASSNLFYYRIKQTDYDGKSTYSDPKTVSCGGEDEEINIVFFQPGVIGDKLNYQVNSNEEFEFIVYMINAVGQQLVSRKEYVDGENNDFQLPISQLPSGIYIFRIESTSGNYAFSQRMVVSR